MNSSNNKKISSNSTINPNLQNDFKIEIQNYMKRLLQNTTNQNKTLFGNAIPLPSNNIDSILKEYIEKGIKSLTSLNIPKVRARSISKYTFNKILENTLNQNSL